MHRDQANPQRKTTGESKLKSRIFGSMVVAGFLASLLYINSFASIGESIVIGVVAALIGVAIAYLSRKNKPE